MLADRTHLRDTIALHLQAVRARIAELPRTAIVLQAVLDRHDEPTAAHLARRRRRLADRRTADADDAGGCQLDDAPAVR